MAFFTSIGLPDDFKKPPDPKRRKISYQMKEIEILEGIFIKIFSYAIVMNGSLDNYLD